MDEVTMPRVSICIPTYNASRTIGATLESVLAQTYPNLVINVVDNNSSDDTVVVVQGYEDSRITLHRNPVNLGGEGNFNRCIELATGKYTAIYHADDIYEPDMVASQVEFLEKHSDASAVFTEASLIDEDGKLIGEIRQPEQVAKAGPLHAFPEIFKAVLEHSNFLICPSVMAHTAVYQNDIKFWRGEMFGSSADLDVWLRMAVRGPIGILARKTMRYRISSHQYSAQIRLNVERAPFFKVTDHYLAQENVKKILTRRDRMNYARLERRDRVMRATNALIAEQPDSAKALCPSMMSFDAVRAALSTRRGAAVFALSVFIKVTMTLGLHEWARGVLLRVKRMAKR
jgi:glycosyltransferase involved in cell wall biosynthesis